MTTERLALGISERVFQTRVEELCRWLRLRFHHETDSRRSRAGFPDLVIVGPAGVIFAELKTDKGHLRPEQRDWIRDLVRAPGVQAFVWRPNQWPDIQRTLQALARTPDGLSVPAPTDRTEQA